MGSEHWFTNPSKTSYMRGKSEKNPSKNYIV